MTLQDLIRRLEDYWAERGCVILPALDLPVGAATFHPETFLRSLGPEPWNCAFTQPCRRPSDGRYGENPNRLQRYYQFQVVLKPSPDDIQDQYLDSLKDIGIKLDENDVRFVEDDWESPTLGAWGRGWEVQLNGMEISQFTYFQQAGGLECRPVLGEITYGLERLAMILQEVDSVFDLTWRGEGADRVSYGDLFHRNEVEQSKYNFDEADTEWLTEQFDRLESECDRLVEKELPLPAYEQLVLCSHTFNLLDSRHAISVTERQKYILRIRSRARKIAQTQYAAREALGFPNRATEIHSAHPFPGAENRAGAEHGARGAGLSAGVEVSGTDTVLFELGTEELPPSSLESFWRDLCQSALRGLAEAGLIDPEHRKLHLQRTPKLCTARRLALEIPDVRAETSPKEETRCGPAFKSAFDEQGQPTKALLGFARSCGVDEEQIKRWRAGADCERTEKGVWVKFTRVSPSRPVEEALPEIFRKAVAEISLDVRMRWGAGDDEFARPVRWIVLMYGGKVVLGSLMGLPFGQQSRVHRALGPRKIRIREAKSYCEQLKKESEQSEEESEQSEEGYVLVQVTDRFEKHDKEIKEKLREECGTQFGISHNVAIRNKNIASTEWLQAVVGSFDERFLELPEEVVETVLEDQLQCFSVRKLGGMPPDPYFITISHPDLDVRDRHGQLAPYFVAIADLPKQSDRIRPGYERVVQARLQDAEFYLRQDRQRGLEERVPDLKRVVFHRKLGTLANRAKRIEVLAGFVAEQIGVDKDLTKRAARLCKVDLTTDMVQAFPNLQGVVGAHYAQAEGEDEEVCVAIGRQYCRRLPLGQVTQPLQETKSRPWVALALADRLDMLVGFFAVGEVPTGAGDPLGVRRAANETVYLMWNGGHWKDPNMLKINVNSLLERAAGSYPESLSVSEALPLVRNYLTDRLRSIAANSAPDAVEAVLTVPWRNPSSVFDRLKAVQHFRQTTAGAALAESNKRIRNILRKTEAPARELDQDLLREPAEHALAKRVADLRPKVEKLCQERQYELAMKQLATLAEPVAKFFDDVLVMAEEKKIRHNRLRLLRDVRELFLTIADLSRLQGPAKES